MVRRVAGSCTCRRNPRTKIAIRIPATAHTGPKHQEKDRQLHPGQPPGRFGNLGRIVNFTAVVLVVLERLGLGGLFWQRGIRWELVVVVMMMQRPFRMSLSW